MTTTKTSDNKHSKQSCLPRSLPQDYEDLMLRTRSAKGSSGSSRVNGAAAAGDDAAMVAMMLETRRRRNNNSSNPQEQQQQQRPQTHINMIGDDDSGNQTDSSSSQTASTRSSSSTPTTADVADMDTISTTTFVVSSASPSLQQQQQKQKQKQHKRRRGAVAAGGGGAASSSSSTSASNSNFRCNALQLQLQRSQQQQQQQHPYACSNANDDNLSESIATTTTDVTDPAECLPMNADITHPDNAFVYAHGGGPGSGAAPGLGGAPGGPIAGGAANANSKQHRRTQSSTSYISVKSVHLVQSASVNSLRRTRERFFECIRCTFKSSGIGEPSVHHALVVIFLEFFAWGLLTMPVISVLNTTFPNHTFLMNGIVMGIKGILSFLSAPLIGALSDIWGRKFFLLITVFFTCAPIPLMTINAYWFFALISISGVLAVTFSVVFAYVADVTTVEERSRAYGLASATFAASLVISPALGNGLMDMYGDTMVVALATAIAVLDVFFILVAVPESLPEKIRPSTWGAPINWEQADPFAALRKVSSDRTILMLCLTVFLSYLPEAGQYSCMFVYLKLKMGFNYMEVSVFIAVVGILSIGVQVTLGSFMRVIGAKSTIILGLCLELIQLLWYGFGSQKWMMWSAGILAALSSITYPAISAFVSLHAAPDSQGAVQGMITGMRGLCNGLGPAMFGIVFSVFNVDLNAEPFQPAKTNSTPFDDGKFSQQIPGPPFAFGALLVFCAILVAIFIPEHQSVHIEKKRPSHNVQYEIETGHKAPTQGALAPLIRSDSLTQL